MSEYIDIHCHIIPQVDDGAKDYSISKEMLDIARDNGIKTIIVTPHFHYGKSTISKKDMSTRIDEFKKKIKKDGYDINIYQGNEVFYQYDITDDILNGNISTMNDSRYVLAEFLPSAEYNYIKNAVLEFLNNGYLPIIAHVERYACINSDIEKVRELIHMGAYIQMNASSIVGDYGKEIKKFCKLAIKENVIHFLATDAHSAGHRAPRLEACIKKVKRYAGEEAVMRLLINNPQKIIENQDI